MLYEQRLTRFITKTYQRNRSVTYLCWINEYMCNDASQESAAETLFQISSLFITHKAAQQPWYESDYRLRRAKGLFSQLQDPVCASANEYKNDGSYR